MFTCSLVSSIFDVKCKYRIDWVKKWRAEGTSLNKLWTISLGTYYFFFNQYQIFHLGNGLLCCSLSHELLLGGWRVFAERPASSRHSHRTPGQFFQPWPQPGCLDLAILATLEVMELGLRFLYPLPSLVYTYNLTLVTILSLTPILFLSIGRNMIEEEFGDISKSGAGRYRYRHRDNQRPKIKNKVKLLFKIHQFESWFCVFMLYIWINYLSG